MLTIIRKNQKGLMLVVAFLTIIAFAFLYNPTDPGELAGNTVARIYGKTLTQTDIDRQARLYGLALALGQLDLIEGLGGMASNEDQAVSEFIWNLYVLRHEAALLGLVPTNEQVASAIRAMPVFQSGGRFDPALFERFVAEQLGPRGLTTFNLEELVRDSLRLETLRETIASGATAGPAATSHALKFFQPADLKILRFDIEPLVAQAQPSGDDVRAAYEKNREHFVAPETVTVEAAKFTLPPEAADLEGRARVAALQEVVERAAAFMEAAGEENFAAGAEEAGAEVLHVGPFDRAEARQGADLPPAVAGAAFLLVGGERFSDVLQAGDDFYVLRIAGHAPERPLTFEEGRAEAEGMVRRAQAAQALAGEAARAIAGIRSAVTAGESLADATATAGVQVDEFIGVDPSRPSLPQELSAAGRISTLLEPGQISNFIETPSGGIAVALIGRGTPPEDPSADEIAEQIVESRGTLMFMAWLDDRRTASGLVFAGRGR
jgi:peptidyl-prolyl cis-trans isomerase D